MEFIPFSELVTRYVSGLAFGAFTAHVSLLVSTVPASISQNRMDVALLPRLEQSHAMREVERTFKVGIDNCQSIAKQF